MIRKIMTGLLAVTMAFNATSSLTVFAKENTSKVTIKTVPPQEWLDEGNYEFSVEFNGDKKKHAFLDKDNGFENTVELTMMQSYTVSFSDEVANYEIGGIDTDFFIPDKEEMTVVLSFKGSGNIAKTNDDGKINEEQAERLAEARSVVQNFLDEFEKNDIEKYIENIYKENSSYIDGEPVYCSEVFKKHDGEKYYDNDTYENLTVKEKFLHNWIYAMPELKIDFSNSNLSDEYILEGYEKNCLRDIIERNESEESDYIALLSFMDDNVKPIWKWLYEQGVEYGDMPNLYVVYMDMKNDVQYEVENGETTENITTDNETKEKINDEKLTSKSENMVDSKMESKSDNSETDKKEAPSKENRILQIVKNNIGILIALVILGVALWLVKKMKRNKKDEDE